MNEADRPERSAFCLAFLASRKIARRSLTAIWASLLMIIAAGGFAATSSAQQLTFRSYGAADGLTDLGITCLKQDRTGYILACSPHGAFLYDGRRFINFGPQQGLPEGGIVTDLTFSADGKIVLRYSGRIFVSRHALSVDYPPVSMQFLSAGASEAIDGDPSDGRDANEVVPWQQGAAFASHGRVLFVDPGDDLRKPKITEAEGRIRLPDGSISDNSPLAVQGNALWVSLADGRICGLSAKAAQCFGRQQGLQATDWVVFLATPNGHLVARSKSMLADIDPKSGHATVTPLPDQGGPYLNYPRSLILTLTPRGELMTQSSDGLIIKEKSGWAKLSMANGLPAPPITSALFDNTDNLWLGVFGTGIVRALGYGLWENLDRSDGLSSSIVWQVVRQPNGPIWAATDGGTDAVGPTHGAEIAQLHFGEAADSLAFDDAGHLWRSVGDSGVARIDVATGSVQRLATPPVTQILPGAAGQLWFLTQKGLFSLDTRDPSHISLQPQGSYRNSIVGTAAPDGSLWMLHRTEILHVSHNGQIVSIPVRWTEQEFRPSSIAAGPAGVIWVGGAGGGLYRLRVSGDRIVEQTKFNPPEILSNTIVSVLVDSRGWVWAGTDNGLSVFNGKRWVSANSGVGLIWDDLDQDGLFEDTDGSIWISTSRGLSHLLDPARLFEQPTPRPVVSSVMLGQSIYRDQAVPYTRDPLVVQFGALGFRSDDVIRFRYQLDGVDSTFADTASGDARYAFVPPGHHRFEVVAYDPLTHQFSAPTTVLIRMKTPWWLWWPLLAIYVAALIGLVIMIWRLRFRYLLEQRRALQRAVELQTREIREAQAALHLQATQDSLTKLLTRGEIQMRLVETLARTDEPLRLTIGLVDIDHFKRINDRFGHLAGDDILREIGHRLNNALRPGEYAGRYGGEEILLVVDLDGRAGVHRMHELREVASGEAFTLDTDTIQVTCSLGVTQARPLDDWRSLIGRADRALYEAKAQGRDRVVEAPLDIMGYR